MKITLAILELYHQQAGSSEADVNLLFDITSEYINEQNWIYDGQAPEVDTIHCLEEQRELKVNCFMLTRLLIHLSKAIDVPADKCTEIVIPNFSNTLDNPYVEGSCIPLFSTLPASSGGLYAFDFHSVAMINGSHFDLLLQAKYPLVNDGANIFSSLFSSMTDNNLDDFESLLPFLTNINEQDSLNGWTLLHYALCEEKFDFAALLLKNGAQDNILNHTQATPLDILNDKIYDPCVSLKTLKNAQEYQELKMTLITRHRMEQLEIENKAARTIQSFWRKKHNASVLFVPTEPINGQSSHI